MKHSLHFQPVTEQGSYGEHFCAALPDREYVRPIGYEPSDGTVVSFDKFDNETGVTRVDFAITQKYYNAGTDELFVFVTIDYCDMDPEEFRDYIEQTWTYSTD